MTLEQKPESGTEKVAMQDSEFNVSKMETRELHQKLLIMMDGRSDLSAKEQEQVKKESEKRLSKYLSSGGVEDYSLEDIASFSKEVSFLNSAELKKQFEDLMARITIQESKEDLDTKTFEVEKTSYDHIFVLPNKNSIFVSVHFNSEKNLFMKVDTGKEIKNVEEYLVGLKRKFSVDNIVLSCCGPYYAQKVFNSDKIDGVEYVGNWKGETQTRFNSEKSLITVKELK